MKQKVSWHSPVQGMPQWPPAMHANGEYVLPAPARRVDTLPAGEICSYGHRNIFRCGFDRLNDNLYCGDVGQANIEEVNLIE